MILNEFTACGAHGFKGIRKVFTVVGEHPQNNFREVVILLITIKTIEHHHYIDVDDINGKYYFNIYDQDNDRVDGHALIYGKNTCKKDDITT